MHIYSMSVDDISQSLNTGIDVFLHQLWLDGVITENQYDVISNQYAIVAHEPGLFGQLVGKLLNHEKGLRFTPVKVLAKTKEEQKDSNDHQSEDSN